MNESHNYTRDHLVASKCCQEWSVDSAKITDKLYCDA